MVPVRKSKPNRKAEAYKRYYEPPALRILVEVKNIRESQRFKVKHGSPPSMTANYFIRGEVFLTCLIPKGFDMVIELYKDEIRRWILHHFPDLKDDQRQLIELERFVWSLTHEIWHVIELNGNMEIIFRGQFEL